MGTRIIFGVAGFAAVLLALFALPPLVLESAFVVLCALATYELLGSTGLVKSKAVRNISVILSILFALTYILQRFVDGAWLRQLLLTTYLLGSFSLVLHQHETISSSEVFYGFFGGFVLPHFLLSLLRIFQMENGNCLVLLPMLAAWGSDTFAYFTGKLFGKHKLAPVVSPKKTVEGAAGGVLGGSICVLIFTVVLDNMFGFALPYWTAILLGAAGAAISQLGDLSFSIIKRQTGIKDYGSIFPGHGGVLDRFDSVIFVAPVVELVLKLVVS